MSSDPQAKFFYGYVEPRDEDEDYEDYGDYNEEDETPWDKAHTNTAHGCIGGIYGYSGNLGNFLAVQVSLHEAEWAEVHTLKQQDFEVQPEWKEQLQAAANHFEIDLSGLQPGWHLVSLYF